MAGLDSETLLAIGLETHQTHACLLEPVGPAYRLAGWTSIPNDEFFMVAQQSKRVCQLLGEQLGRTLWDSAQDSPLYESQDPMRYPPIGQAVAAATTRPRLRIWLVGLSATVSLTATRQILRSSPVQIVGTSHLVANLESSQLADELIDSQPDVIVMVGGYDNATGAIQEPIMTLSKVFSLALRRMPPAQQPAIFYAGNRQMGPYVQQLLSKVSDKSRVQILENVQPLPDQLRQTGIAQALTRHHWQLCQRAPGFARLDQWVASPAQITSMEWSFAQLVQAWRIYQNMSELHGLYCSREWWLHVWASHTENTVHLAYVEPNTRPQQLYDWPPLGLVSGQPTKNPWHLWDEASVAWWDSSGIAPSIAPIGQVSPQAMIQVLSYDLFQRQMG